jgi:ankyrin repeat protein
MPDPTPLFSAIRARDLAEAARLLDADPELLAATDKYGQNALHVAAEADNPDAIDLLLGRQADPEVYFGKSVHTALSWALTTAAYRAAAALVRGGVEPDLFCAAGLGDVDRVRAFFDEAGQLREGASRTGSSRYLADGTRLATPTDPRELVSDALCFAARNGRLAVVEELLRHDPDLGFRGFIGGTALHWASYGGNREVQEALLAAGADPTLRDHEYDCTPRAFGICVVASWDLPNQLVRVLAADPGVLNLNDGRGTGLHEAARAGNADIVKLLLTAGADRALVDREGKTALDLAQGAGHDAVVALLS